MKVQIVSRPWANPDRIIPRLAILLSERTGWPVRRSPGKGCEVAYYFNYLEMPEGARPDCLTAAWFTHRDTSLHGKPEVWDGAAAAVDLRLTSARLYLPELEKYGPTRLVTPPLDRDKFCMARREPHQVPVVGTSGYSYPGGRKGEELVAQLAAHYGKTISLVASGRGWPAPTRLYPWREMQRFYQDLDLYVCTSSIEGIGYGPLEALSCGIPVVVPLGVGIFDELPDLPGIYRYRAGDVAGFLGAVQRGLDERDRLDREQLRAVTGRYDADAWVADHVTAFEALLAGTASNGCREPAVAPPSPLAAPVEAPSPDWRGRSGVYMVAYGEPARRCALRAIDSVHRHMPGLPVALCSDSPLGPEDVLIQQPDGPGSGADIGGRKAKLAVNDLAPAEWAYVLYLDCDTELFGPLDLLFDALVEGHDACWTHNPPRDGLLGDAKRPDNGDEYIETAGLFGTDQIQQLNGGVFSFRRSAQTTAFFQCWQTEYQRTLALQTGRDQLALLRTLRAVPLRLWLLGRDFNAVGHYGEHRECNVLRHYPMAARRWEGPIHARTDSPLAWQRVREWERVHAGARR